MRIVTIRRVPLLLAVWLAGCSTLQPIDNEAEFTPPPSQDPFWLAVDPPDERDWFAILNEGPDALDWRLRAIDTALESIDLQTFLWTFDTSGAMVLDHLVAAADRGVLVKLLIDDTFLVGDDRLLVELHEHPNIQYRVFNPYKRRTGGFVSRVLANASEFGRLDHRMHNKAMIIDNRVAIVGGRNIADEYFGLHADHNFRDMEVIVGGPVVASITASFDQYWNGRWSFPIGEISRIEASAADLIKARMVRESNLHVHDEESYNERFSKWRDLVASAPRGKATLFVDDPPTDNPKLEEEAPTQLTDLIRETFMAAREEVLIITAYLIPTPRAEELFAEAVDKGIRVRILTNSIASNNHLVAHSAYRNHIMTLLKEGAELHEVRVDAASRGLHMLSPIETKILALHAKTLVMDDDKVFIGSPNLDPRSLRLNTEMGLLIESHEINRQIRDDFEPDFERDNAWHLQLSDAGNVLWVSDDETLTVQPANSFMQRIEDWFFRLLPIEEKL